MKVGDAAVVGGVDLVGVKRALFSVSDKTGVVEFASALQREFGVELLSTGGTAKVLREAGLVVKDVAEVTGFPEMMDGRVKTLHPVVHGGLLGVRGNAEHEGAMAEHGIGAIDLICVNLYPFEETVSRGAGFGEVVENIDIGGPAMIRSAAKNHRSVVVVTDVIQYEKVLKHMRANGGKTPLGFRMDLAYWAYARTGAYDGAIAAYFGGEYFARKGSGGTEPQSHRGTEDAQRTTGGKEEREKYLAERAGILPAVVVGLERVEVLRYGENPHQLAGFYQVRGAGAEGGVAAAKQLHGKALSYINILDADAAMELVREFDDPAAAVIKHTNPCGCAAGLSPGEAFDAAYAGDPVAAFGGIVALNREVDVATAERIVSGKRFLEVVIAPGYAAAALAMLNERWKDCRILATGALGNRAAAKAALHFRSVTGGMLVQQADVAGFDRAGCVVTSERTPTEEEWRDLGFAWLVTKHVKSNAIAVARGGQLLGAGAGQMSRPMSAKIAVELARKNGHSEKLGGSVAGSDAFFPFPDGAEILIDAGVKAIIHPGGSKKDQETIDLCNRRGVALVATGRRHFAH